MPKIIWKKGEQKIIPSETNRILYDEETGDVTLIIIDAPIETVQPIVYKIEAKNEFGRAISKIEVMQIVEQPEQIMIRAPHVTPLNVYTIANKATLRLRSCYMGVPEPTIRWLKNGKEIVIDTDATISTENGISELIIQNMDRKRGGKYEIVAVNEAGESRASGSVTVSDDVPSNELLAPHFIQPLQPKTVLIDDVVILETCVQSQPDASFQWFCNSMPITITETKRIHTQNNRSVLYIERFTTECDGIYMCRAENVAGSVTSSATTKIVASEQQLDEINEYLSPRFIEKLKPLRVMDGDAMKLICRVIGYPTPIITWCHNKRPLTPNKGCIITQDTAGQCELSMPEVFVEDDGIYSCKAINKFGKTTTKTNVIIEGIIKFRVLRLSVRAI